MADDNRNYTTDTKQSTQLVFNAADIIRLDQVKELAGPLDLATVGETIRSIKKVFDSQGRLYPNQKLIVRTLLDATQTERPVVDHLTGEEDINAVITLADIVRFLSQAVVALKQLDPQVLNEYGTSTYADLSELLDWGQAVISGPASTLSLRSIQEHSSDISTLINAVFQTTISLMYTQPETGQQTQQDVSTAVVPQVNLEPEQDFDHDQARNSASFFDFRHASVRGVPMWKWEQLYVSQVVNDTISRMFTEDELASIEPGELAEIRSELIKRVVARFEIEFTPTEIATLPREDIVARLGGELMGDTRSRASSPVLSNLYSQLKQKVNSSKEHVTSSIDESTEYVSATSELERGIKKIGLGPHEAIKAQQFVDSIVAEHGARAAEYLSRLSNEKLFDQLASFGVSVDAINKNRLGDLVGYIHGVTRRQVLAQLHEPQQFFQSIEDQDIAWQSSSLLERQKQLEAAGIERFNPEFDQLLVSQEIPSQLITPAIAAPVLQQRPSSSSSALPGTLAAVLEEVLPEYTPTSTQQSEYTAQQLAISTQSRNPEELREKLIGLKDQASQRWSAEGEQFIRAMYPKATETEIQQLVAQGPSAAYLSLAANRDTLYQVMQAAQTTVGVANNEWQRMRDDGTVLEILQAAHPRATIHELQELARSDKPDPEFTQLLLSKNNNPQELLKDLRESRGSAAEIWNKQLSQDQQYNLLLKARNFSSREELEEFIASGQHYSLIAHYSAEGFSPTAIVQLAANSTPSAAQVWQIATVEEKQQLVQKVVGGDSDAIQQLAAQSDVPIAVAASIQKNRGQINRVLQDTAITPSSAVITSAAQPSATETIPPTVNQAVQQLSVQEQNALLLSAGKSINQLNSADREIVLNQLVFAHLEQGNNLQQLRSDLRTTDSYSLAVVSSASPGAQELLTQMFADQPNGEKQLIEFVELHGNNLTAAVQTAADLNARWAQFGKEAQANYLHRVLGLSPDEVAAQIGQNSNTPPSWFITLTHDGRNLSASNQFQVAAQHDPIAQWLALPSAQQQKLLSQAGISGQAGTTPPPEVVYELLHKPQTTKQDLNATQIWQAMPAELKTKLLTDKGFTPDQITEALSTSTPPAEAVVFFTESQFKTKEIIHKLAVPAEVSARADKVEALRKVVSNYTATATSSPEVAADVGALTVDHGRDTTKKSMEKPRISNKQEQYAAVLGLLNQIMRDPSVPDADKLTVIKLAGNNRKINFSTISTEELNTLSQQTAKMIGDVGSFYGLIDNLKKNKLPTLSQRLKETDAKDIATAVKKLPVAEDQLLRGLLHGDNEQATLLIASALQKNQISATLSKFVTQAVHENEAMEAENNLGAALTQAWDNLAPSKTKQTVSVIRFLISQHDLYKEIDELNSEITSLQLRLFMQQQANIAALEEQEQYLALLMQKLQAAEYGLEQIQKSNPWELPSSFIPITEAVAIEQALQEGAIPDGQVLAEQMGQPMPEQGRFASWRDSWGQRLSDRFGLSPQQKLQTSLRYARQKLVNKLGTSALAKLGAGVVGGPAGWAITGVSMATSKNGRKLIGGGIAGLGLALANNPVWLGSALGSGVGFMFGGPIGAAIGGGIGWGLGHAAKWLGYKNPFLGGSGTAFGSSLPGSGATAGSGLPGSYQNALNAKLAPNSGFGGGSGGAGGGQGAAGQASGLGAGQPPEMASQGSFAASQAAAPTAATASTVAPVAASIVASMATTVALAPLLWVFFSGIVSIYFILVIAGAFLVPVPTDGIESDTTSTAEYIELSKFALPKSLANNSSNSQVKYVISIKPKKGATIILKDVRDTFSSLGAKESVAPVVKEGSNQLLPTTASSSSSATLAVFGTEPFTTPKQYTYTVTVDGGTDIFLRNTVVIVYDAIKDGKTVETGATLSHASSVKIGNPKVQCWPTTGIIYQLPFGVGTPGNSHQTFNSDAYDIANIEGTAIYSPFDGVAEVPPYDDIWMGHHVYVFSDLDGDGKNESKFIFMHMWKKPDVKSGDVITIGQKIGEIGSTGNSTGNHLHYELKSSVGTRLHTLVEGGDTVKLHQKVTTCFGP